MYFFMKIFVHFSLPPNRQRLSSTRYPYPESNESNKMNEFLSEFACEGLIICE